MERKCWKGMHWLMLALVTVFIISMGSVCFAIETWQSAQLLNSPSEITVKSSRVCGSKYGGFHAIYSSNGLKYRRFQNGSLGPVVTAYATGMFNPQIAEAGNGDIHIVWEDWFRPGIEECNIGWAKSTNGGASFTNTYLLNPNTKFPCIAHYGADSSSTMVLTSGRINHPSSGNNNIYWTHYNGSSWISVQHLSSVHSEYQLEGMDRAPDGSVWKIYCGGDERLYIRRFNGTSWESPICVDNEQQFRARLDIAVNSVGQVMCVWSLDEATRVKIYTPGVGFTPRIDFEKGVDFAKATDIPGRKDFYLVYMRNQHVYGRRYCSNAFGPEVAVSINAPHQLIWNIDIDADAQRVLYVVFEDWPGDEPQQYWTKCNYFTIIDPTPPSAPGAVYDDGASTDSTKYLHFTWTPATDSESGVEYYEYSIGTSPGATNVQNWLSCGSLFEYTVHNLTLAPGATYYINVRAINYGGVEGSIRSSDGILCDPTLNNTFFGPAFTISNTSYASDQVMIAPAGDGGIHATWRQNNNGTYWIGYRNYSAGAWQLSEYAYSGTNSAYFPDIVEDVNGDVHVIYEMPGGRENNVVCEVIRSNNSWGYPNAFTPQQVHWYPRLAPGSEYELVHVIANWDDNPSNGQTDYKVMDMYYNGFAWDGPSNIGDGAYVSMRYGIPDVAADASGNLHVCWTNGSRQVLYTKRTGTTWSTPVIIYTHASGFIAHPRIAVDSQGYAHIVYADHNIGPDHPIYYVKQTALGTWSSPVIATNGEYPDIAVDSDDVVHIVYGSVETGNSEIYHKFYTGSGWSQPQNLSNNSGSSDHPAVCIDKNGNLHVTWQDNSYGAYRILHRKTDAPPTCASVKQLTDGTVIELRSKVVTAIFSDETAIYVEEPDRTSGIRVEHLGSGLNIGDRVNVGGQISTRKPNGSTSSERYIIFAQVNKVSSGVPLEPVAMTCKAVGGAADGPVPGVIEVDGTPGVGVNNIGSLVTITGKVTLVLSNYIWVDDGSDIDDISGRKGVMVNCNTTPTVSAGDVVSVTGIVEGNIPTGWSTNRRYIRCRTASDINVHLDQ